MTDQVPDSGVSGFFFGGGGTETYTNTITNKKLSTKVNIYLELKNCEFNKPGKYHRHHKIQKNSTIFL